MAEDNKTTPVSPETTEPTAAAETKAPKTRSKKAKRNVPAGELHIQATFNNTIITITDKTGKALLASSAGANGFKGSKKGTAFAAGIAAEKVAAIAKKDFGMHSIDIFVKGVGLGRETAIRSIGAVGITIGSITDVTPVAHGGVRPKGQRKG